MQMLVQALETLATASGVNSSMAMYGSIFLMTASGMLSLSKVRRLSKNLLASLRSFLLDSQ